MNVTIHWIETQFILFCSTVFMCEVKKKILYGEIDERERESILILNFQKMVETFFRPLSHIFVKNDRFFIHIYYEIITWTAYYVPVCGGTMLLHSSSFWTSKNSSSGRFLWIWVYDESKVSNLNFLRLRVSLRQKTRSNL